MNVVVPKNYEAELHRLTEVFLEENQKLNLSALRTEEACWNGNVLDSVAALDLPVIQEATTILDLGTGGGFPLLPLTICLPKAHLTGLDSTGKKIAAIGRIMETMNLRNVSLITGRAEDLGHDPAHREQYDIVTARAVAPLPALLEYMVPFVKVNGHLVVWKSLHIAAELQASQAAQNALDCHLLQTHEYELPGDFGRRQLLVFQKRKATSAEYPRPVGMAKKIPLQ